MSRERKYRVWDKEAGRMYLPLTTLHIKWNKDTGSDLFCEIEAVDGKPGKWACSDNPEDYEIMQYTGLKDKNGKDIYEGDIYTAERSYMPSRGHKRKGYPDRIKVICVVEWSDYDAGWKDNEISPIKEHIEFDKNCPYHYHHTSLGGSKDGNVDWVEVIGNIYQNPELINQEKE